MSKARKLKREEEVKRIRFRMFERKIEDHKHSIHSVVCLEKVTDDKIKRFIVSSSYDGSLRFWNSVTLECEKKFEVNLKDMIKWNNDTVLCNSSDKNEFFTASLEPDSYRKHTMEYYTKEVFRFVKLSDDNLVCSSIDNRLTLYSLHEKYKKKSLSSMKFFFDRNSKILVSKRFRGSVFVNMNQYKVILLLNIMRSNLINEIRGHVTGSMTNYVNQQGFEVLVVSDINERSLYFYQCTHLQNMTKQINKIDLDFSVLSSVVFDRFLIFGDEYGFIYFLDVVDYSKDLVFKKRIHQNGINGITLLSHNPMDQVFELVSYSLDETISVMEFQVLDLEMEDLKERKRLLLEYIMDEAEDEWCFPFLYLRMKNKDIKVFPSIFMSYFAWD